MIINYIKIAIRNLKRNKIYTSINVIGLTVGLTAFLIIALFIQYESSFDKFHNQSDNIYRVIKTNLDRDVFGVNELGVTSAPLNNLLMENYSEVQFSTQLTKANSFLEVENEVFSEQGIFVADHFFDVFSYPFLFGNPSSSLSKPNGIVISKRLAQKYFGKLDVVGETMYVAHEGEYFSGRNLMEVTGVMEEIPANSHLTFDYVIHARSSDELVHYFDSWNSNQYLTYVLLKSGVAPEVFQEKIATIEQSYSTDSNFKNSRLDLQPLKSIHLFSNIFGEFKTNGSITSVLLFGALATIILLIACINYTNLATAQSFLRAREVGVRKAIGANRTQLVSQFLSESVLMSLMALVFAFALVQLLLPIFNEISARELILSFTDNASFIFSAIVIGLFIGVLAGSYPAFKISKYEASRVLKGINNLKSGNLKLRNILVIAQFTATTCLIIATITVFKQLNYFQSADTGLNRTQILSVTVKDQDLYQRYSTLKSQLERNSNIELVSAAQSAPIAINSSSPLSKWEGSNDNNQINVYRNAVQHDFIDLFDIEIVEGRNFSKDNPTDITEGMIINETLKKQLGWENAVGKEFSFRGREATITGVVKDFNYRSFHQNIEPLALFLEDDWWFPYQNIFIKMNTSQSKNTLAYIEDTFSEFSPGFPFEYQFLDDTYNNLYQSEIRMGKLFNYFTIIALLISCMGIFGLTAFSIAQRKKEIGIRKVLGASIRNIIALLSIQYLKPVIIGFLIATPIAWFSLSNWLQGFSFKIDLGIAPFIIAGFISIVIALLTVGGHCLKAASANPVNSLYNE